MKKNDGFPYDKEYGFDLEGKDITVLLVEDSETDAGIVLRLLSEKMPCRCHVLRARTLGEAEGFLSGCCEIDVALLDLGLPDSASPHESYERLAVFKDFVPIIVLTCLENPKLAMSMLGIGAQDYVYKNSIIEQPDVLRHVIEFSIGRHLSLGVTRRAIESDIKEKSDLIKLMMGSYSAGN
ncbi:MAG TPA: hypothetical protein PKI93_04000 [Alphaproteobacteria bacterium]|nr:hypothetical protein [Alphaproteobacteria bacterium]HNS43854.1 hypothetical protein [Alphaproteobacteria bacterium]